MVPGRVLEGIAELPDGGLAEVLLGQAEALADHVAQAVPDHVVLGRHELGEPATAERLVGRGLDQQNAGPGAILCAASTSVVVSAAASTMSWSSVSYRGTRPTGWMMRSDGGPGSPQPASKTCRS